MHRVVVLALEGVYPFELSIPVRIFGTATGEDDEPLYEVITCSLDGGPVTTDADFAVTVEHGVEAFETADTLVIPPFTCGPGEDRNWLPEPLADAFTRLRRGTRIVSICTASYVLAAAGLLDGRRATTHWQWARRLATRHPEVHVDADPIFIRDGDYATSAGVTAALDLTLAFIEEDNGVELSRKVARGLVTYLQRPGNQAQMSMFVSAPPASNSLIRRTVEHITGHLDADLTTPALAAEAGVSERHLTRLFLKHLGQTPGRYVRQARTEAAAHLLASTSLPMAAVAARCGFGTAETLRQAFVDRYGIAPSRFRLAQALA
jgi:transcriptional regulator GlxA family with amidase domain